MAKEMIGYARVSSSGQSLEVQLEKLKACQKVYQEKASGLDSKRTQLQACLEYVREGDTLVVSRLDRLARSTLHLCQIANELDRKGVNLKVIDQNIDTSDATGRLLFNMLGAIAQFETEIRSERQMEGITKAKKAGISFGRRKTLSPQQIIELKAKRESHVLVKDLMKEYGISEASIYRYLNSESQKSPSKNPDFLRT